MLEVITLDINADVHYAKIRIDLEAAGTPIGPNDLLIAAHAMSFDLTLVTTNLKGFSRVSGLAIELA